MTNASALAPMPANGAVPAAFAGNQGSRRPHGLSGRPWSWPGHVLADEATLKSKAFWQPLMERRGVADEPAARATFLQPALRDLLDPAGIRGMAAATERLWQAHARGERVCIYGDYDVDGVSASSLLAECFAAADIEAEVYIPDRRAEGYGLNAEAVAAIAGRCQLLVTVDCGSTSLAELGEARALGLDAVVVDHHQVGSALPEVVALLNPHQPACSFAYVHLCATGVAFMLAVAIRRAWRQRAPGSTLASFDVRRLLDLVALATVADMVPLTGLNRILVAAGVARLRTDARPGLAALMQVAGVQPAYVTSADLGFRLGPRINARGRLAHAGLGVTLMRARTREEAMPPALALDEANRERRTIEGEVLRAAIAAIQSQDLAKHAALVVGDHAWHPGVLGLVASRLSQRYGRPTLVVGEGGKGSARSIDGLDLHACLRACADLLLRFGGHPAAAGVTMDLAQLPALREALSAAVVEAVGAPPYVTALAPELEIHFACMHLGTVRTLAQLEPFGRDNPEILFATRDLYVQAERRVGEQHLKLRLSPEACPGAGSIDAIAFGHGDWFGRLPKRVDVLFHLERHVFRGLEGVQMRIVDLRAA